MERYDPYTLKEDLTYVQKDDDLTTWLLDLCFRGKHLENSITFERLQFLFV